jgi:hypothetical protein
MPANSDARASFEFAHETHAEGSFENETLTEVE